jgi:hypothetical protein
LFVEVTGEQLDRILQLALAVDQRALAKFGGHHDRADEDRRDQKPAAKGQPQHRPPDRRGQMPSDRPGPGADAPHVLKEIAHSPFSRGYAYNALIS